MTLKKTLSRSLVTSSDWQEDLVNVLYDSQLAGYPGKPKTCALQPLSGCKLITWKRGSWKVTDVYSTTPISTKSGGMTTISYADTPVWLMQYLGEYEEAALRTLKRALNTAYAGRHNFNGGRGDPKFIDGSFTYYNIVAPDSNFSSFSGREYIIDIDGEKYGYHKYQGCTLF